MILCHNNNLPLLQQSLQQGHISLCLSYLKDEPQRLYPPTDTDIRTPLKTVIIIIIDSGNKIGVRKIEKFFLFDNGTHCLPYMLP
jgi:hypothetical protein